MPVTFHACGLNTNDVDGDPLRACTMGRLRAVTRGYSAQVTSFVVVGMEAIRSTG